MELFTNRDTKFFIYRDNRFYSWLFTIVADRDMGIP